MKIEFGHLLRVTVPRKMFVVTCIFILLCGVYGVILPGRCPKTPPTHLHSNNITNGYVEEGITYSTAGFLVLYSLRYTKDNISYVFYDPLITTNHFFIGDNANKMCTVVSLDGSNANIISSLSTTSETKSITVNSTLKVGTQFCKPMEEEIRLWFDGDYMFVWGCREIKVRNEHDEALIISRNHFYELTDDLTEKEIIQKRALKYVTNELLQYIDFTINISDLGYNYTKDRVLVCPNIKEFDPTKTNYIVQISIVVVVVVVGMIATVLYHYCN